MSKYDPMMSRELDDVTNTLIILPQYRTPHVLRTPCVLETFPLSNMDPDPSMPSFVSSKEEAKRIKDEFQNKEGITYAHSNQTKPKLHDKGKTIKQRTYLKFNFSQRMAASVFWKVGISL